MKEGSVVGEFVGAEDVSIGETVGAKVMGWVLGDTLGRVDGTSVGGEVGGLIGGFMGVMTSRTLLLSFGSFAQRVFNPRTP